MSNARVSPASDAPIDPYCWRHLPISLGLHVAAWAALLAWLYGGSDGAGNLYAVWSWFLALVSTIAVTVEPKRLYRGAPVLLRWLFAASGLGQVGMLAWFGCWWVFAPCLWALVMGFAQRHHVDQRIAAQEALHA